MWNVKSVRSLPRSTPCIPQASSAPGALPLPVRTLPVHHSLCETSIMLGANRNNEIVTINYRIISSRNVDLCTIHSNLNFYWRLYSVSIRQRTWCVSIHSRCLHRSTYPNVFSRPRPFPIIIQRVKILHRGFHIFLFSSKVVHTRCRLGRGCKRGVVLIVICADVSTYQLGRGA